jgi:hypothetical protein
MRGFFSFFLDGAGERGTAQTLRYEEASSATCMDRDYEQRGASPDGLRPEERVHMLLSMIRSASNGKNVTFVIVPGYFNRKRAAFMEGVSVLMGCYRAVKHRRKQGLPGGFAGAKLAVERDSLERRPCAGWGKWRWQRKVVGFREILKLTVSLAIPSHLTSAPCISSGCFAAERWFQIRPCPARSSQVATLTSFARMPTKLGWTGPLSHVVSQVDNQLRRPSEPLLRCEPEKVCKLWIVCQSR